MTINHRMKAPKEMATEVVGGNLGDFYDAPKAAKRMARICATPSEIEQYKYNPNGARNNLRPGIPVDESYDSLNSDTYSD